MGCLFGVRVARIESGIVAGRLRWPERDAGFTPLTVTASPVQLKDAGESGSGEDPLPPGS